MPFVLRPFSEQIDRYCTMCPLPERKGIVEAKENNFSLAISLSCKCPNPFIMTVAVVL